MKFMKFRRLAPFALLFAGAASGQSASSITGVVTDASTGKPVVGALVVATSPAAGVEQTAVTDAKGNYKVSDLPPGDYTVAVQFEGYKPAERSDLALKAETTLKANLTVVPEAVQMEEVVVTGSRIKRKDLTTAAPVTVIDRESIATSGKVSIGDFLQALPEQGDAINTGVNNGGDGSTRVSLRNLGDQRTLVLVNGRRMVPGGVGADASVDLSSIPAAAIERIEVLKDGASALYGSDAIAGVVNIITRKNWNGTETSVYTGTSSRGDAQIADVNVTTGVSGERGSAIFGAGYYKQWAAMAGDRSFSKFQLGLDKGSYNADGSFADSPNGQFHEYFIGSSRVPGGRVRAVGNGNALWDTVLANNGGEGGYLIHDSTLARPSWCPSGTPTGDCQWRKYKSGDASSTGDAYNFAPLNYLITPQERINLWTNGEGKFGDFARGYYEASYVNRQSRQQLAPEPLIIGAGGVYVGNPNNLSTISKDNLYNPFGVEFSTASRRLSEFGPRSDKQDVDTFRVVAGLDGTLPEAFGPLKGWSWDTNLNFGRTNATWIHAGSLQNSHVANAIGPSMLDGTGQPVCVRVPGDLSTKIAGCVPLDLFHGDGSITKDQIKYLRYTGVQNGNNQLVSYQANTSGELFTIASDRPVGLALGYEWRQLSGAYTNDPISVSGDSTNGASGNTSGSYIVNEGYGELSIPILSGRPGIDDLEVQVAGRLFHYSNFGSDGTYKLGARYRPIRDITVRGTYSTAFRAPSISELYQGNYDNFPTISDPCATTDAGECGKEGVLKGGSQDDSTQLRTINGGNPNLKAETAKTFTFGLVWEPQFLKSFSATLDYYNVDISKAITTIGESTILAGCYNGSHPEYCDLISRDPSTHMINSITNLTQNVGSETAAGIDLGLQYQLATAAYGRFGFTFDGTYLLKHNQTLADGEVIKGKDTFDLQNSSGEGGTNAAFKFNAAVVWGLGNLGAGVSTKFISGFHECGASNGDGTYDFSGSGLCYVDSTVKHNVPAYNTYDLFVSYGLDTRLGHSAFMVGVNNVFDTAPPKIYNTFASATDQYTYDQIQRYYYARVTQAF